MKLNENYVIILKHSFHQSTMNVITNIVVGWINNNRQAKSVQWFSLYNPPYETQINTLCFKGHFKSISEFPHPTPARMRATRSASLCVFSNYLLFYIYACYRLNSIYTCVRLRYQCLIYLKASNYVLCSYKQQSNGLNKNLSLQLNQSNYCFHVALTF